MKGIFEGEEGEGVEGERGEIVPSPASSHPLTYQYQQHPTPPDFKTVLWIPITSSPYHSLSFFWRDRVRAAEEEAAAVEEREGEGERGGKERRRRRMRKRKGDRQIFEQTFSR